MTTIRIEQTRGYYSLSLLIISLIFLLGCSKEDNQAPDPAIDTRLVGTWKGRLNNSSGQSEITMLLLSDGTTSLEVVSNPMPCPFLGTWTVLNNRFKGSYNDDCNGSTLILNAPFAVDSLIGDWDSSTLGINYSGTFSVGKQ